MRAEPFRALKVKEVMYYRKNRSILRSIRNNKNNKTYYMLVVVMLAAICLIAASIILRGYGLSRDNETVSGNDSSVAQSTDSTTEQDDIKTLSEYRVYVFVQDGVVAYCGVNSAGEVIDIIRSEKCYIGDDVKGYLSGKRQTVLSGLLSAASKATWKEVSHSNGNVGESVDNDDNTAYYVQYYSVINGIEFHSAIYTENGNYNSIVKESYEAIGGNEAYDSGDVVRGITLSAAGAKAIYENVPSTAAVYICESFDSSELNGAKLLSGVSYNDIAAVITDTAGSEYRVKGELPLIPDGFSCDPTDSAANYVFSPYRLGAINNVSDKTAEAGQIAYSFIDPVEGASLIHIIFNDVTLTDENGEDISSYLIGRVDLSAYADVQIAGMNVNGFLLPGDYIVGFYAADVYGTSMNKNCYLHVVDTTPPVIALNREVTEINQAQMENPDYIRGMVTVTDLCKLSDDGVSYELTEADGRVHISFSTSDVYGNIGVLEVELQKVE